MPLHAPANGGRSRKRIKRMNAGTIRALLGTFVIIAPAHGVPTSNAQTDSLAIEADGTVTVEKSLRVGRDVSAHSYFGKGAVPVGAILM